MRKFLKNSILEIFQTMYEAHININKMIENKDFENVQALLEDCQNTAVQIGTSIETSEGEGFVTVSYLEEYCEVVYAVATSISEDYSGNKAQKVLDKKLIKAENSVKNDVKVRLEIAFCPYKVSMWDSLESVWKAAVEDPDCDAYVVPIPYYDRNPDQSFGEFHYEGGSYPDYVPIVHYEAYKFETRRPDVIYIHNPYDDSNYVTSVDPRFYLRELKKYTEKLVYIPYFIFPKKPASHLISDYPIIYADYIIVQNKEIKQAYDERIKDIIGQYMKKSKVYAIGSPKIDKIVNTIVETNRLSVDWKRKANGKKIIFMNTNVSLILNNGAAFIENMQRIFGIFKTHRDSHFVIWREHPLSEATIKSMRYDIENDYKKLKNEFLSLGLGEFDTAPEAYEAMAASDCYFGAGGSLIPIYSITGKPMMVTDYHYPNGISEACIPLEKLLKWSSSHLYLNETHQNSLSLFLDNIDKFSAFASDRLNISQKLLCCIDGTVGHQIHKLIVNQ